MPMNRPSDCNHEDFPCCGCGPEPSQEDQREEAEYRELEELQDRDDDFEEFDGDESMDGDHESALESVYGPSDPPDYIDDTPLGHEYGDGSDHD